MVNRYLVLFSKLNRQNKFFDVFNNFFGTTGDLKETTEVKVENDKTFDEQNEHKTKTLK